VKPFNPLDKRNLGASVAKELLFRPIEKLPPQPFQGAGVYAIYYTGLHRPYALYNPIATHNHEPELAVPIYVGKAVPAGARVGGFGLDDQLERSYMIDYVSTLPLSSRRRI